MKIDFAVCFLPGYMYFIAFLAKFDQHANFDCKTTTTKSANTMYNKQIIWEYTLLRNLIVLLDVFGIKNLYLRIRFY